MCKARAKTSHRVPNELRFLSRRRAQEANALCWNWLTISNHLSAYGHGRADGISRQLYFPFDFQERLQLRSHRHSECTFAKRQEAWWEIEDAEFPRQGVARSDLKNGELASDRKLLVKELN